MNIMTMTTIIHIHLKMTVFLQVMVIIFGPFILFILKFVLIQLNYGLAIYLINHKPNFESNQDMKDAKLNSCLQQVTEMLGVELAKDVVTKHLIKNKFNIDNTVDDILTSKIRKLNLIWRTYACIIFVFYIF